MKTIGKRVNMKGTEIERMDTIETFHLQIRALQLSGTKHPVYGFTSPYYVISHDQVPLELAVSNSKTVHDTGCDCVYDAVGKDSDTKRFCTLNLFGAMLHKRSGLNIPPPHLVFAASGFREGANWHDAAERAMWDPRVVVSFQENAWVDAETHMYGLKEVS